MKNSGHAKSNDLPRSPENLRRIAKTVRGNPLVRIDNKPKKDEGFRLPTGIERNIDIGRFKLAGSVGFEMVQHRVRGRISKKTQSKTDFYVPERRRKVVSATIAIKTADSFEKAAIKRTKPLKNSIYIDLTRPERGRSELQQNSLITASPKSARQEKNSTGLTGLAKLRANMVKRDTASNKHVVDTSPLPSSLTSTGSTEYDPHKNYNTNLAAPSDSSLVDLSPQLIPPRPRDPSEQYPADQGDTGLHLPGDIPPFFSKKSSRHPEVPTAFCDRASITLELPKDDLNEIISRVRDLVAAMKGGLYTLRRIPPGRKKLYDFNYKLVDAAGNQVLLLQFQPKSTKMRFCRIETNPKEIGPEGIYQINLILKGVFGPGYRDYLAEGNFTRLDATLDINKLKPDDVMMVSNRARNSSRWQKSYNLKGHETWETETICLGSSESDYFATIYDKAVQLWRVKGECLADLRTRIEARINPRGKDGRAILVKDILQIMNPFAVISIAYYPAPDDDDPWFEFFVCASRHFGQEEALRKITDRSKRALYRYKLLENEPDWWQPEKLWAEFLSDLKATGLFPDEIFGTPIKP